ncbi:MAG TPA: pyruvate, water dikinase regulatory protein [Mariniphaga sp.]|nr:pyruvate, water dikinase regulatory protein [Mariniphaga sp.]
MNKKNPPPIYVVSGGRGLAGNNLVQSLLIQYPDNRIPVVIQPNINTDEKVEEVVKQAKDENALITHTMVNPKHRKLLNRLAKENNVCCIDFMGDLAKYLDQQLDIEPLQHPGLYRQINQEYFERIEAIEFTLSHDDGMGHERLQNAEIVLTGVSRVGKTPLSVYLAMFGWKVANVPLVKGIQPPKELFEIDPKRVFGLHIGVPQLIAHRKKRLKSWNNHKNEQYVDENSIKEEIRNALFIFERGGFTILNVTNKPIESTANEILNMISERFSYRGKKLSTEN